MKRLLSCTSSEMLKMDGQELKQAILASEGRTVMTETVVAIEPLLEILQMLNLLFHLEVTWFY